MKIKPISEQKNNFLTVLYQFSSYDVNFWLEFADMSENLYANLIRIPNHYLEKN